MDDQHAQEPQRRRLGRGLNALLGTGSFGDAETNSEQDQSQIHVDLIDRNPFQPRQDFEPEALNELVDSIRQHGILQSLLVRPVGDGYQLIAGERRLIAAKKAGLELVPCRVLELSDQQVCEVSLEENLKRQDLNVLEKAIAFQDYLNRFQCPIEELARRLSLDRSTVSNMLRLLELPDAIKDDVRSSRITAGHARALLSLQEADQLQLSQQIQQEHWSVRRTEEAVRALQNDGSTVPFPTGDQATGKKSKAEVTNHILSLQDQLRDWLGTKVEIKLKGKEAGKIVIEFTSNDDFERLLGHLRRAA
ncbi:ParB/RepB/Spo0J family partition protein [bacterium]|nr:ParB/RepB/Spo0J family partition protein [bacterium]